MGGIGDYSTNKPVNFIHGNILWVLCSLPRYQYTQWSAPQGPDILSYLKNQSLFIKSINISIKNSILCRPYPYNYGWDDLDYLKEYAGSFSIDNSKKPIRKLLMKSKLVIFTYDSTSMMESMALNIPTVCFWDPEKWPWRNYSSELLNDLKSVNIFHENPIDLANYLNEIIDNDIIFKWQVDKIKYKRSNKEMMLGLSKWISMHPDLNITNIKKTFLKLRPVKLNFIQLF